MIGPRYLSCQQLSVAMTTENLRRINSLPRLPIAEIRFVATL